jgi:hypothetical protein
MPPTARIRRVVLDHATSMVDRVVSHISSIVMPLFGDEVDMIANELLPFGRSGAGR